MSNVDPNLATATGETASKHGTNVDGDDKSNNKNQCQRQGGRTREGRK